MKLRLIDENLPETLTAVFGPAAVHATQLGSRLSDRDLWLHARKHDGIIITKDVDFFDRLAVEGAPPKVVWVRTGNLRRVELEALLARVWPEVENLLTGADLVEVHADRLEALSFDK